ncbi:MAG: type II secretion system protein [Chitinispirillaceae bacterium]|nr:type II secretion system protein [Chitinispirillaceae bacterium]
MKGNRGFSFITLIVALIIVAVLVLVGNRYYSGSIGSAVQNGEGYVDMAKASVVNHAAATAAQFITEALSQGAVVPAPSWENPLTGGERWTAAMPNGSLAQYVCPKDVEITFDEYSRQVQATAGNNQSDWYSYGNQ